ncbi:hypothetical protein ACFOLG_01830 [Vogesella facilis]|uniref:Uncharacterized protein n=1 Tax=Vogesella facilis TaxID=1655232 RepID=A0ABV7R9J2_9NEIS
MIFSQYIMLEKVPGSVDPLGFLKPSSALADKLFRQFTVLSNHPAYHGFLCCAYDYLRRAGVAPGQRDFSRRFRDLEILWGLINVWERPPDPAGRDGKGGQQGEVAAAAVSILNVTKFKPLLQEGDLSLPGARSFLPLYQRLNYGTLGHYSSPSMFWGLLDAKGVNLTPVGQRLAEAWRRRGNLDFDDLLRQWDAGKQATEIPGFDRAVGLFPIAGLPSAGEKAVWLDLIEEYCRTHRDTRQLWESPLSLGDLGLYAGGNGSDDVERARQRASFFPTAIEHWQGEPELTNRLRLADGFEMLAAVAQAILDWEYVLRLDETRPNLPVDVGIPEVLFELAKRLAEPYLALPGAVQPGTLFESMATAKSAGYLVTAVLEHHASHQKSKGAMAYIDGEHVAVRDKVDVNDFARFIAAISANPSDLPHRLRWRYRRDWHFLRAETWRRYANGVRP